MNYSPLKFGIIVLSAVLLTSQFSLAQVSKKHVELKWKNSIKIDVREDQSLLCPNFEGALYNENLLPEYFTKIAIPSSASYTVRIEHEVYEPLQKVDIELNSVSSSPRIVSNIAYETRKSYLAITICPIRKNTVTGLLEKLRSFDIVLENPLAVGSLKKNSSRNYANNSILNSGTKWFRMAVVKDGVYALDAAFFRSIGANPNDINPRNIRIYGSGGGQLPAANNSFRHDDLPENAITVVGETDGKFDEVDKVLFYGQSQTRWSYNDAAKIFSHKTNNYADTTYYFLNFDIGAGKRIPQVAEVGGSPTSTVSTYDEYDLHEIDKVNFLKSGIEWFGETFDIQSTLSFPFSFTNLVTSEPVQYNFYVLSRATSGVSGFTLKHNNAKLSETTIPNVPEDYHGNYANPVALKGNFLSSSNDIGFSLTYNRTSPSALGWLDYAEVNARCRLALSGAQLFFRDARSVAPSAVARFEIDGAAGTTIWNVSDPVNVKSMAYSTNGNQAHFNANATTLAEYVVFKTFGNPAPVGVLQVANQNLHDASKKNIEMVIVCHSGLYAQAKDLADFHRDHDGLNVSVVDSRAIYNEFSSGAPDITAIRDYCKMLYDRNSDSTHAFKYLLMFGDGSYDNKSRLANNSNLLPTYQSRESLYPIDSYTSDDYFALLDDNEGDWSGAQLLDIGVGRIPARSASEAAAVVNKIRHYATSKECLGDWRSSLCFISDDEEGNQFTLQSEDITQQIEGLNGRIFNFDKLYFDAFKQEVVTGGQRYPEVNNAINNRVERGALIINYIGHGGETGWALERVLNVSDIEGWSNINNLPMFMTATCEFSRFDDPERTSAGELVLLNPKGGGIAMFTTVRLVYASSNFALSQPFYEHAFPAGTYIPTLGQIYRKTKNDVAGDINTRNFTLLGDPALRLSYPKDKLSVTSINTHPVTAADSIPLDTLKAMAKVSITGEILSRSTNGKLSSFSGVVYPTIYDKSVQMYTLSNDGSQFSPRVPFKLQKNILYKGKVSVKNGEFTMSFIVPKDIAYSFGKGRISMYAEDGNSDASGTFENFIIGGISNSAINDVDGPGIKLYMNSENFAPGSITDASPTILALLADSSGINTVGNGIGHDITAILDNDQEKNYTMNDYYEADLNSYQKGAVRYPLHKLSSGQHTLRFKAWDVFNNSSEKELNFVVSDNAKLALEHVLNYPNPFTTNTNFYFNHNKPGVPLDVQVQIFTITGKVVKSFVTTMITDGYISNPIQWNGLDEYGDKIGKGVYIYRLKVRTPDGATSDKLEKLVILN